MNRQRGNDRAAARRHRRHRRPTRPSRQRSGQGTKEIGKIEAKLDNAPEEVIEEHRDRLAEAAELKAKFEVALEH